MIQFRILFVVLIAIALLVPVQAQEDGLVAEWHFDEGAGNVLKDSSGNGNDGIIFGASWVDGKFGKALSFGGTNNYVNIPASSINNMGAGTIALWISPSSSQGSSWYSNINGAFFGKQHNGIYNMAVIGFDKSTLPARISFCLANSGGILVGTTSVSPNVWHYIVVNWDGSYWKIYVDGIQDVAQANSNILPNDLSPTLTSIGAWGGDGKSFFKGLIDEVRIYSRALSASEIKELYEGKQTSLTLTKTASPYSIKQGQTTTITLTIKNTGTTDIANIEVMDSIHRNFDLIGGDFPNPRKFDIIGKGESREIQYMIKAKDGGTFNLDPATGIYADKDGNILEAKSEPFSVKVIPSFEGDVESPSSSEIVSSAVLLHGEKTDVVLGEDILLKLSAVNLITKPLMTVQVIIYPPSGMSVTGSEFVKSGAGIYTTTYSLNPGDGKDIEIHIKSNQVGDFGVKGRIVYYFGDDKKSVQDHTLTLPIKVRKEIASMQDSAQNPIATTEKKSIPSFGVIIGISGILFAAILKRRR